MTASAPKIAAPKIAAVILAAGSSQRAGALNKLMAPIGEKPMITCIVDQVCTSRADTVAVVSGFESDRIHDALAGRDVSFAHNPEFGEGMGTSIAAGIGALGNDIDGALICLGDMPNLNADAINQLIDSFDADGISVPVADGRRGNPVLFAAKFFPELIALNGDAGAKAVVGAHPDAVHEIAMTGTGTTLDLDTAAAIDDFNASSSN
ncbi:MAG: nucleotidyltransferase family protein [Alphaproteobacteria bacterium]|jgi:molybdenum cofactor cytidylyltransferase